MNPHGTAVILPNGHLSIGGCDTTELARRYGTPLWVLDEAAFRGACRAYREAFSPSLFPAGAGVVYASKALLTLAVCRLVEEEGLNLDVVSGGELFTALKAGYPRRRIHFGGNNKSPEEIREALAGGVGRFVVDNADELEVLDAAAGLAGVTAEVVLRLNPGLEVDTHDHLKTGQVDSKFGVPMVGGEAHRAVHRALELGRVHLRGLHCHVGSQLFETRTHARAAAILLGFAAEMRDLSGWEPEEINLGGGFGLRYAGEAEPPRAEDFAPAIAEAVSRAVSEHRLRYPRVLVEPGRAICGPAGWTLYTVGWIKEIPGGRTYVSVDGGMGDNPRPALYQAVYEACLADRAAEPAEGRFTLAGKCCESGDILIRDLPLPRPRTGDLVAVSRTGAYNYTMSMNYNRLPRPAMVMVSDGRAEIIVERETYDDLIAHERIPARLLTAASRRSVSAEPEPWKEAAAAAPKDWS